jgi:hypothetical protein
MKFAILLATLALASCGGPGQDAGPNETTNGGQAASAETPRPRPLDDRVECAIGGGDFARSCTMDVSEGPNGLILVIRNEAGGFRRLRVPSDGSGAVAADGAERAEVSVLEDGRAEVAIGGDRYRLPVAIGPAPRPR